MMLASSLVLDQGLHPYKYASAGAEDHRCLVIDEGSIGESFG